MKKIFTKPDMPHDEFLKSVAANVTKMILDEMERCNSEMVVIAVGVAAPDLHSIKGKERVSIRSDIMWNGCEGVNVETVKAVALEAIKSVANCEQRIDGAIQNLLSYYQFPGTN